ncbi:MAG TPA: hypothetical protein VFN57_14500 [Thermomicrobiaceae bacterium]|nr:hypothetical protein [Thermomicrobiaceae bacterium]
MWAQLVAAAAGIWLIVAPAALASGSGATTLDRIVGPLAAATGLAAAWRATRILRWVNLPVGLTLVVAPWFLGLETAAVVVAVTAGVVLVAAAFLGGRTTGANGGGWRAVVAAGSAERH